MKQKNNWQTKKLEKCIEKVIYGNKVPRKKFLKVGKFPIVSQEINLVNGYWDNKEDVFKIERPVVVFGDHTKIFKYIEFDFVLGADGVKILKPQGFLHPKLFYYQLIGLNLKSLGYARHYRILKEKNITYPPLPEQKRIVKILDEVFEKIEKAKENAKKNLENSKELFELSLGKVLKEIKWVHGEKKLGEFCHKVEYGTSAKSKKDGKVIVLRMGNIQNGKFIWDKLVYSDNEAEIEKYRLHKDDVLFNRTNSPELVGKTAIYKGEKPAIFAGYLIRIHRKKDLLDASYLNYFLNSGAAREHGKSVMTSSVNQANINGSKLKDYPICVPPLTEQKQIVKKLDALSEQTKKLEKIYQQKLDDLEELKKSVLKSAFKGEL